MRKEIVGGILSRIHRYMIQLDCAGWKRISGDALLEVDQTQGIL